MAAGARRESAGVETSRGYAIERGGPERIELRWGAAFRTVRVLFDGVEAGVIERKKIPRDGAKLTLKDGSVLSIRLRGVLGIEVLRNDEHLPGSDLDPRRVLKNAGVLMVIAALADTGIDWLLARRMLQPMPGAHLEWSSLPRATTLALGCDAALFLLALPTALGSRIALGIGVAAFASRFGVGSEHPSAWTLTYGVCTTWLLATHFFATFKRKG
jgi:hypothetical protein